MTASLQVSFVTLIDISLYDSGVIKFLHTAPIKLNVGPTQNRANGDVTLFHP